jgi:hypothetical protein
MFTVTTIRKTYIEGVDKIQKFLLLQEANCVFTTRLYTDNATASRPRLLDLANWTDKKGLLQKK